MRSTLLPITLPGALCVALFGVLSIVTVSGCCDEETALQTLPRCEDVCPMGPDDAWLCTRNPNDGVERCACPANDYTPQPCDGDL